MTKRFEVVALDNGGIGVVYSGIRSLKRAEKLAARAARREGEALLAMEREAESDGQWMDYLKYARAFLARREKGTRGVRSREKATATSEIRVYSGGRAGRQRGAATKS